MSVRKRIMEHKDFLITQGFSEKSILGVFLYGSQNYGTDLETSDVDTKALYLPTSQEAILNPKLYVKEFHLPNGEHCEVMDIRHFVNQLRKQNINFVEILYTQYNWVNENYEDIWTSVFHAYKECISKYDMNKTVKSISGQTLHTLSQGLKDGKKVSNGLRLLYFLKSYLNGVDYLSSIYPDEISRAEMKRLKAISELESDALGKKIEEDIKKLVEDFDNGEYADLSSDFSRDRLDTIMNNGILRLIRKRDDND